MAKKGQNDKTTATAAIVATHEITERKGSLEVDPIGKKAIFGQKMPKKCHFAIPRARSGNILQIRLQNMKIQIFLV